MSVTWGIGVLSGRGPAAKALPLWKTCCLQEQGGELVVPLGERSLPASLNSGTLHQKTLQPPWVTHVKYTASRLINYLIAHKVSRGSPLTTTVPMQQTKRWSHLEVFTYQVSECSMPTSYKYLLNTFEVGEDGHPVCRAGQGPSGLHFHLVTKL